MVEISWPGGSATVSVEEIEIQGELSPSIMDLVRDVYARLTSTY